MQLKETQPKLPVFLLSEGHELEDIISCIRAGVTDVIDEPKNLKIFDTTNEFSITTPIPLMRSLGKI